MVGLFFIKLSITLILASACYITMRQVYHELYDYGLEYIEDIILKGVGAIITISFTIFILLNLYN